MVFFVALAEVDALGPVEAGPVEPGPVEAVPVEPGPVEAVPVGDGLAELPQAPTARMTTRPNARVSVRCRRRIAPPDTTSLVCIDTRSSCSWSPLYAPSVSTR